jgi:hypothetical protein
MMSDDQFDEFVDICYEALETKQANLMEQYCLGSYERYWLNGEEQTLDFITNEVTEITFRIIYIGTWSHKNNNWMWAWANESMTDQIRAESRKLEELKELTGYEVFKNNGFECDELMSMELTAMAVNQLSAIGMYRIPGERSHLYVAIMEQLTK